MKQFEYFYKQVFNQKVTKNYEMTAKGQHAITKFQPVKLLLFILPRKSVFNICFLYRRSLGTDRPSHSLILQVLKGLICPSLDAGLNSNLALFTAVMFSSCFGVRQYPKSVLMRKTGRLAGDKPVLLFIIYACCHSGSFFYQVRADFSLI